MYYKNKINTLREIFNTDEVSVETDSIKVAGKSYPVLEDVIVLAGAEEYPPYIRKALSSQTAASGPGKDFSEAVQFSFGEEWKKYDKILPEHEKEFSLYFDLVNIEGLKNKRTCDLGCGNGRWSYFLKDKCRELIMVDFSDAIFTARKNLKAADNCLFFLCNLKKLPFKNDFADLLFSLGVLHHLPTDCIKEVRNLKKYSPELLIFLYYALDNRPFYFRLLLMAVTLVRKTVSVIRNETMRSIFTALAALFIYLPLIYLGRMLDVFNAGSKVPLYDFYKDKSVKRIKQDVYDRFFTSIEQRVTRKAIMELEGEFSEITISKDLPYWHFLCKR